jgi:hypothetical protein
LDGVNDGIASVILEENIALIQETGPKTKVKVWTG